MKTKLAQSKSKWVWKRVKTPGGGIRYFSTGDPKTAEFFKGLAARLRSEDKAKRATILARATKPLPEFASRPYLVAFIDILGFGREIEKASTQEDLEKAYRKIRRVQEEFQHPSATEDRTQQTKSNQ